MAILASACGGAPEAPPTPFKPVADNFQMMEWIMDPAADVIWGSVGWIIDEKGTTELVPKTDEEWAAVRNAAAIVAESGNLLMMPSRALDDTDWMEFCQGLVDAAVEAMKAAEAKDKQALFDAGGRIYSVCAACHQQYLTGGQEGQPQ
jgi:cytochrome c553